VHPTFELQHYFVTLSVDPPRQQLHVARKASFMQLLVQSHNPTCDNGN